MKSLKELNDISETKYDIEDGIFDLEDGECFLDEALQILLKDGVVWCNSSEREDKTYAVKLLVNSNDVLMWNCGDAIELDYIQIEPLIKYHLNDFRFGCTKWVCIHYNMQPQAAIKRDMVKEELWDDDLEALPINAYD